MLVYKSWSDDQLHLALARVFVCVQGYAVLLLLFVPEEFYSGSPLRYTTFEMDPNTMLATYMRKCCSAPLLHRDKIKNWIPSLAMLHVVCIAKRPYTSLYVCYAEFNHSKRCCEVCNFNFLSRPYSPFRHVANTK